MPFCMGITKKIHRVDETPWVLMMGVTLIIIGIFMPVVVREDLALVFSAWFMIPGTIFAIVSAIRS